MPLRRYQPPAYSPVSASSLRSGTRALLGSDRRRDVVELLNRKFAPLALVLTDSGTSALRIAIESALKLRPGRVALPAYSCYDVSSAAEGTGADVLLYDLEPTTLGPDAASLEDVVRRGASVVVAVHLYGVPADVRALDELRRRHGVVVVEDAAQGFGAMCDGQAVGTLGELSVLSFARGKGVTGGGGGALLAHDADLAPVVDEIARQVGSAAAGSRQLGSATAVWLLARPSLYAMAASMPFLRLGETIYRSPIPAAAISRASLGILTGTIELSEIEAEERKKNAAELLDHIRRHPDAMSPIDVPVGVEPSYLRLPILAPNRWTDAGLEATRQLGIMRGYPQPLSRLPSCTRRCANINDPFPGAEQLASRLATLPTHSRLRSRDKEAIRAWITAQS